MKQFFTSIFGKRLSKQQCSDTGMALVLVLLLLNAFTHRHGYLVGAIVALVINMTVPSIYRPLAVVWFGLSHLLGAIVSRIILTVIYIVFVTPVALVRQLAGKDSLKLKAFRVSEESAMVLRNHTFTAKDIEKPY